jgi:hypothetical protein
LPLLDLLQVLFSLYNMVLRPLRLWYRRAAFSRSTRKVAPADAPPSIAKGQVRRRAVRRARAIAAVGTCSVPIQG